MGGMVDRRRIREQEDWAPKELQGDVGSAKLARLEVNMCRAPLCSSPGCTVAFLLRVVGRSVAGLEVVFL